MAPAHELRERQAATHEARGVALRDHGSELLREIGAHRDAVPEDERHPRIAIEHREWCDDPARFHDVVGIVEGEDLAARDRRAAIARCGDAQRRLALDPQRVAIWGQGGSEVDGRAVVDDDHLEIAIGLPEDRGQARGEEIGLVAHRNDDRDARWRRAHGSSSRGAPPARRGARPAASIAR